MVKKTSLASQALIFSGGLPVIPGSTGDNAATKDVHPLLYTREVPV
jgi:hypothetical protein